jgi:hypothetical protein
MDSFPARIHPAALSIALSFQNMSMARMPPEQRKAPSLPKAADLLFHALQLDVNSMLIR